MAKKEPKYPVIELKNAEVVFVKHDTFSYSRFSASSYYKIVVVDPVYAKVYFTSSASGVFDARKGDKISCKLSAVKYCIGDPNGKYKDDCIIGKRAKDIKVEKFEDVPPASLTQCYSR